MTTRKNATFDILTATPADLYWQLSRSEATAENLGEVRDKVVAAMQEAVAQSLAFSADSVRIEKERTAAAQAAYRELEAENERLRSGARGTLSEGEAERIVEGMVVESDDTDAPWKYRDVVKAVRRGFALAASQREGEPGRRDGGRQVIICEICQQPGGDPLAGTHITEAECLAAKARAVTTEMVAMVRKAAQQHEPRLHEVADALEMYAAPVQDRA